MPVVLSCNFQQETKGKTQEDSSKTNAIVHDHQNLGSVVRGSENSSSILDSIEKKQELSIGQIRKNTLIDSVFYTDMYSDADFAGDTVFKLYNNLKGAVINYNDKKSCLYKFLLLFDSANRNISNKIIYSDCDHDESADYTTLRYRFLSRTKFEIVESFTPANSKMVKVTITIWNISKNGALNSISKTVL